MITHDQVRNGPKHNLSNEIKIYENSGYENGAPVISNNKISTIEELREYFIQNKLHKEYNINGKTFKVNFVSYNEDSCIKIQGPDSQGNDLYVSYNCTQKKWYEKSTPNGSWTELSRSRFGEWVLNKILENNLVENVHHVDTNSTITADAHTNNDDEVFESYGSYGPSLYCKPGFVQQQQGYVQQPMYHNVNQWSAQPQQGYVQQPMYHNVNQVFAQPQQCYVQQPMYHNVNQGFAQPQQGYVQQPIYNNMNQGFAQPQQGYGQPMYNNMNQGYDNHPMDVGAAGQNFHYDGDSF